MLNILSCKEISHLASRHIDNDLPFFLKMKVRMHIFICHDCRNFIKQFRATVKTINQIKIDTPKNVESQVQSLMKISEIIKSENMGK